MLRCPACNEPMREMLKHDVLIDVCPRCRGVWLDRGELEKILAAERAALDYDAFMHGHRKPHYDYHYDYHHHKKKKKHSFLEIFEDLFD